MPKKSYYRPREAAALLGVSISTLRFWEDSFPQFRPERVPSGHRRYTQDNVEMGKLIKHLLRDKGLSLEYARKELSNFRKYPPRHPFSCKSPADALHLLAEAKSRCDDKHAIARIEAVEKWMGGNLCS